MKVAGFPANERERLKALEEYDLLDTAGEPLYDSFTQLARQIAGTNISFITLVDERRAWVKSGLGINGRECAREESFCSHVVESGNAIVVRDARKDRRFLDNPKVIGEPFIRFYAGIPLTNPQGYTIGTVCVFDDVPKTLSESQMSALVQLGRTVMTALEGRRRVLSLFDAAHIDVFTIDPNDETISFAPRGASRRLGYTRTELIGMPFDNIMPGVDTRREGIVGEAQVTRRDGSSYPVELRLDIAREDGEDRILAIASDLTQRRLAEKEIELLLGAINVAGDVILVFEVTANGELRLAYMNEAYAEQSGYTRDEALGRTLDAFRQAMPDDEGMLVLRAAINAGIAAQSEIVGYRKDGTTYWNQVTLHPVRNAGEVTHWISIERDITEEVARTSTLAEEHDRVLALTRAARRLFTALDARTLVTTVRDVIAQLIGGVGRVLAVRTDGFAVPVDELGGADWSIATKDALAERAASTRSRVIDEDKTRALAPAGQFAEARYVLELRPRSIRALRNTDLFVFDLIAEYFAVAARNVSLYHELDERRSAVLELNQTKSDLITMLAHDFRGPLTSIVGFSDLTSEVGETNEEQREFLDTIKRSALQLSELATDTLTLSRLERNEVSLRFGEVDLEVLAASIVSQYADRRRVTVGVNGDPRVTGDDERLRQVFANLIDNAIKYSLPNADPDVEIEGRDDDVVVTVSDRGIGIPPGELSRVFDRFSRASNARRLHISGTGFGLFLTKQLVQLHGGTIAVESEEGKGSRFIVTLPRRVDGSAGPRSIVIVDPQHEHSFLSHGLQEAGYRVLTVATLDDALNIADSQFFDALILAEPDALGATDAVQFRAFSRERAIPIVAIGGEKNIPRLMPAATVMRPVLIGDVVAVLERLLRP
jgi:PAS domain S-box-containing protein